MLLQDIQLIRADTTSQKYLLRKYLLGPMLHASAATLSALSCLIPKSALALDRPIFVVGCSRSGTSVFVELFSQHADLANWSEAAQVLELKYYDPTVDHYKDRTDVTEADALRIRAFFGAFARLTRKRYLVNKHPQNSLRIAYLKAVFPDARFVHVVRDGRAVVASHLRKVERDKFRQFYPFGNFPKPVRWREYLALPPLLQYAYQWRDVVSYVRGAAESDLADDEYVEIRYEDLCNDPRSALAMIDAALGLDPRRRYDEKAPPTLRSQNAKWREEWSTAEVRQIEAVIGDLLQEFGYEPTYRIAGV